MYNNGRFMSRPNFRRPMKKKKGNALAHLEKFTAVQQLAIFCPDLKINIEQHPTEAQYFKASCFMRGRQVEAFHKGKKNARQALCTKIIKVVNCEMRSLIYYISNSNCSTTAVATVPLKAWALACTSKKSYQAVFLQKARRPRSSPKSPANSSNQWRSSCSKK